MVNNLFVATIILSFFFLPTKSSCQDLSFQGAELTGPKRLEITPSYTLRYVKFRFYEPDPFIFGQPIPYKSKEAKSVYGIKLSYGLSERVDLRSGIEFERDVTRSDSVRYLRNYFQLGPKISLVKNRLSLFLPFHLHYGVPTHRVPIIWGMRPELIFTQSLSSHVSINSSLSYFINDHLYHFFLFADNPFLLSLSASVKPTDRWVIRPEIGISSNPTFYRTRISFGLGSSIVLSR